MKWKDWPTRDQICFSDFTNALWQRDTFGVPDDTEASLRRMSILNDMTDEQLQVLEEQVELAYEHGRQCGWAACYHEHVTTKKRRRFKSQVLQDSLESGLLWFVVVTVFVLILLMLS